MRKVLPCVITLTALFSITLEASELVIDSKYIKNVKTIPSERQWKKAKPVAVPLVRQDIVSPHGGSVQNVDVSSIYTDEEIFIRLTWQDKTRNTKFSLIDKFSDACAVEMPVNAGSLPSPFMGEKSAPVNIWMWRAISREKERIDFPEAYSDFYRQGSIDNVIKYEPPSVENLIAEGFGTITPLDLQDTSGTGLWNNDKWSVIIKRNLGSISGGVILKKNSAFPIAFAVWDGNEQECDGQKSISVWHILKLGDVELQKPQGDIAKGKNVYLRYGCITCHGKEGKEPVANLNAAGGMVPSLTYVAEGYTLNELKSLLRNGRVPGKDDLTGPYPPLWMKAWKTVMDEEEVDALAKYLFSLLPEEGGEKWGE